MGKEKSRGNAFHLGSDEPANTFTVQSPPKPITKTWIAERLEFLHKLLWGQEESLFNKVFCDFQHPSWNRDMNPHINSGDMRTAGKLTLSNITSEAKCLPCRANELLVRNAYKEMYNILLEAQELRMKYLDKNDPIPDSKKTILILGQPGIGKTWFLSYVLVRRLLEGKPTIFQNGEGFGADSRFDEVTHYLINENGAHQMDEVKLRLEEKKADIWVLADQTPKGKPRQSEEHNWLVVVTSSPREANYKYIVKNYSPQKFYLPTWDWDEVVAAA